MLRCSGAPLITANYFYPLSAAVYKLLRFGSEEFSSFLHDIGYRNNGKTYKLFTFALQFEQYQIINDKIKLLSPEAYLYITSPLIEPFISNFVMGTFIAQQLEIFGSSIKTLFIINQVESLPDSVITEENKFKLLSAVVLSMKHENKGKLIPQYLRYNDPAETWNRILNDNLRNKFELITNKSAADKEVLFTWDNEYIRKKEEAGKRITRKQTIKQGMPEETEVIANMAPFIIKGDKDLIKTGYDSGFGSMNSLGFGMAEII